MYTVLTSSHIVVVPLKYKYRLSAKKVQIINVSAFNSMLRQGITELESEWYIMHAGLDSLATID